MTERSPVAKQTLYMQKFIEKILTHFLTLPHFPQAEPMWTNTWSSEGYRGFPELLWTFKSDYYPCWIIAILTINHGSSPYMNQHQQTPNLTKKRLTCSRIRSNQSQSQVTTNPWPPVLTRYDWKSEWNRIVNRFSKSYSEEQEFSGFQLESVKNVRFCAIFYLKIKLF